MMIRVNPYLTFDGRCEEAFDFYRAIFGGEFESMNRFSEMPEDSPPEPGDEDLIMHISLPMGDGHYLMGSDRPASMGQGTKGDNVSVSVTVEDAGRARKMFEMLADGGKVTMPFDRTFWGSDFGMCIDRFGVYWMVDSPVAEG
ncbi:MAG TPA: VOC family protein [Acidimicrobiia bacterium]|nr:VOC family protein [Acidimicrobiia bacterium]